MATRRLYGIVIVVIFSIIQVKTSVCVPVVANGDIRNEDDVKRVSIETQVDGIATHI